MVKCRREKYDVKFEGDMAIGFFKKGVGGYKKSEVNEYVEHMSEEIERTKREVERSKRETEKQRRAMGERAAEAERRLAECEGRLRDDEAIIDSICAYVKNLAASEGVTPADDEDCNRPAEICGLIDAVIEACVKREADAKAEAAERLRENEEALEKFLADVRLAAGELSARLDGGDGADG